MHLERLWLTDFRSYRSAQLELPGEGLTVVEGPNGSGKTNLIESMWYLSTLRSFRGASTEAMVRAGAESAVVRAEGSREGRRVLVEAELRTGGRDRVQVNRQPLRRARDLLGALVVTVFSPDDLDIVDGPPAARRQYLDDLLVSLHPRHDATQADVERVLRQRNALLRSVAGKGRPGPDVAVTLDVWDAKLAESGEALVRARRGLTDALHPLVEGAYRRLAGDDRDGGGVGPGALISLAYQASWEGSLLEALGRAREADLRRGVSTVGPHRDELTMSLEGMPARTHASRGEQRCLALALRLGGHRLLGERLGASPMLLLDDVFSELDPARASALVSSLPEGQAVLTTASGVPDGAVPALRVRVEEQRLAVVS